MSNNENMPSNLFARAFAEVGYGDLGATASDELQKVIKAVRTAGKKGSVTITLEVKPRGRDSGQVEFSGEVKAKAPIAPIAPVMVFITEEGDFTRENPAQGTLPFGKGKDAEDGPSLVKAY